MSSARVKRAKPSSATTVREVVRAVSTRDGVDARNVNGEVAMDVDARRVDLVEATLATCRAAEKAMFEATSARECAEATACARAAFEIARATGERRSTRDRARASGAFEAVSSLARACAACAACRAGSRRGDAGGGAWAAARWETDARDVVALVRALVRASGEDVRLGRDGGTRSRRVRRDGGAMRARERAWVDPRSRPHRDVRARTREDGRARVERGMSRVRCGCAESPSGVEVAGRASDEERD